MSYHAKLSPSSAKRWVSCTASISAQDAAGLVDAGSEAARLGTCAHQLSAECLEHEREPQSYLDRKMVFWTRAEDEASGETWSDDPSWDHIPMTLAFPIHDVIVTQEMIDASDTYINFVREQAKVSGATLYVEQRVPIGHITGEEDAGGTSDVVMTSTGVLTTIDAKFGRQKVMAYDTITPAGVDIMGEPTAPVVRINLQLALYLLGALKKYPGRYVVVKAIIVQPFLNHVSEYSCPVEELLAVGEWLKGRAQATRTAQVFEPTQDNCHFCKARMTCQARETSVLTTALAGFTDIDSAQPAPIHINHLGSLYDKVGMIQQWCKDVGDKVYNELMDGRQVMRNDGQQYKLVVGKKGNRQFDDEEEVETIMKALRLRADQMYTRKLISASAAEKLSLPTKEGKKVVADPVLAPKAWARLAEHITQAPGAPTVALETDPRPAFVKEALGFADVITDAVDCADLF